MSQQSYVLSGGLCKVSASLFLIHLAYPGPQVKPGYGLVGLSAVWTVTCMLVIALRGDLGNPWSTLDGSSAMVSLLSPFMRHIRTWLTLGSMCAGLRSRSPACLSRSQSGASP